MREVVILRRVESREPAFHQPPGGASWAWIGEHAAHAPILSARFAFRRERRFPIAKARLFHQLCWWFCGLKHTTKNTHCTLSLSQPCSALSLPLAAARQTGCRKGVRFSFSRFFSLIRPYLTSLGSAAVCCHSPVEYASALYQHKPPGNGYIHFLLYKYFSIYASRRPCNIYQK